MAIRPTSGGLTAEEKRVVKRLLERRWRNQDIQALINTGRPITINSARTTEVKQNNRQRLASDEETDFFILKKRSFDPSTGLNLFDDERLIRAREAMMLAVQVFNSAGLKFKTEVFAVMANIAWTYLLHEYYERRRVQIIGRDGRSLLLSQMVERHDCPLSDGIKNNLRAMKLIRDDVEHLLLKKTDLKWQGLYQACCLNFEKTICELFGERVSLADELAFALQFTKTDFEQISELSRFEIPPHIEAIDARRIEGMTEDQLNDLEYQFRVVYTFDSASKSKSHIQFVNPDPEEGKEIRTVLVKTKTADELYPFKPGVIPRMVSEQTDERFTTHNHTQAWKLFRARPENNSREPANTNKDYCIFHSAHKDYTYSQTWVDFLIGCVNDPEELARIKSYRF